MMQYMFAHVMCYALVHLRSQLPHGTKCHLSAAHMCMSMYDDTIVTVLSKGRLRVDSRVVGGFPPLYLRVIVTTHMVCVCVCAWKGL